MSGKIITIFGGSKPVAGSEEYEFARRLGYELGRRGYTICNGGYGGTMEATARGAREAGAKTIGVTVKTFADRPNRWIDEEISADDIFQRIKILIEKGDAYIALKDGTGTLAELAMLWDLMSKNIVERKPFIAVNFWTPVIETVASSLKRYSLEHLSEIIKIADSVEEIIDYIEQFV